MGTEAISELHALRGEKSRKQHWAACRHAPTFLIMVQKIKWVLRVIPYSNLSLLEKDFSLLNLYGRILIPAPVNTELKRIPKMCGFYNIWIHIWHVLLDNICTNLPSISIYLILGIEIIPLLWSTEHNLPYMSMYKKAERGCFEIIGSYLEAAIISQMPSFKLGDIPAISHLLAPKRCQETNLKRL